MEFFLRLFDTSDFPARWSCGRWSSGHGWLHVLSDLGIWSAYFTIPLVFGYFVARRKDLPFRSIFLLFAAFIVMCGTTHLMEAVIFWWPAYRLAGVLKLLTAVVSWTTVFALIRVAPNILAMRSPDELEREVVARKAAERRLQEANEVLEHRVEERTNELSAAVAELRAERERLTTTLASIGDAVITTDNEGRITNMNAVAESLTAWKIADAMNQPLETLFKIVNEETRNAVENPVTKALREGVIVGLANHTILIGKDGTERPIDDSAAPIRDRTGAIFGCVLVFRDISERHRQEDMLRQSEARFRLALRDTGILVYTADADLRYTWVHNLHPHFRQEDVIGRRDEELLPPEQAAHLTAIKQQVLNSGTGEKGEITVEIAGRQYFYNLAVEPLRNASGEVVGVTAAAMDITAVKRAEEERHRSMAMLRAISDTTTDLIYAKDQDCRLVFANPGTLTALGLSEQEALGKNEVERNTDSSEAAAIIANDRRIMQTGQAETFEEQFTGPSGTRTYMSSKSALRDEHGVVTGVIGISRDITDIKRMEADLRFQLDLTKSITDNATTAIFMMDDKSRCTFMNPAAVEMTGFTLKEVECGILHDFIHHHHPDGSPYPVQECPIDRALPERFDVIAHEDVFIRKNGEYFPVLVNAKPIRREGSSIGTVIEVRDVTKEKAAADALRLLALDLSEADRRKDEFLATLAHELRNPLAPIRSGLEVMKLAGGDARAVELSRSIMERQLEPMVRLIDDLMDVSRITRGKVELRRQHVTMAAVVNNAVEACRPLIDQLGHQLSVTQPSSPILVDADPTRLGQVFVNLLNNAAKYSNRGGQIWLTIERQGIDVIASIRDTGIGIPSEKLTSIFDMFSQVEQSLGKAQGGLGIGLTLVKRLVEMHGGGIEVKSAGPDQGSEFIVRLPIVVEEPNLQAADGKAEPTDIKSSLRILVVDDNKDGADSLAMMLKMMGNETHTAYDGQEGVKVSEQERPDVILFDIGLPNLNGYEACRRIREQEWGKAVTLIALTGWGQEDDRRRSQEAGFDHHMVKPVDPTALMKLLAELNLMKE